MGALARVAVKRTKTVPKPPHRACRVRGHRATLPARFRPKLEWNARIRILGPWLPPDYYLLIVHSSPSFDNDSVAQNNSKFLKVRIVVRKKKPQLARCDMTMVVP